MKRFAKKISGWAAGLNGAAAEVVSASAARGAALARGLAPVDSGELRSGISVHQLSVQEAAVVSAVPYSAMVEYGTARTAAQPYMLPMAQQLRGEFRNAAAQALKEAFL